MTEHRRIENLLRAAKLESKTEVNNAVLKDLLEHWERDIVHNKEKPEHGRHIMNSRISKLTAAAFAIVLVLSGILYIGDNIQGVSLGAIVESMHEMTWIHVTATIEQAGQISVREQWECFNPKINIWKNPDGSINYRNYVSEISYVYEPDANTITISPTTDKFNQKAPQSPSEGVQYIVEQFELGGGKVIRSRTTENQVAVEIIQLTNENQNITLIVDVNKNVPLSMNTVAHIPQSNQDATVSVVFDYPKPGPMDIYSVGAALNARIIDNRPKGDVQILINEIQKRFDAGFEDHIAILLESYVGDNNVLEPAQIMVMRQKGDLKRLDRYHAYNFTGSKSDIPTLYTAVKNTWPDLSMKAVIDLEEDKFAEFQAIFYGDTSIVRTNLPGQAQTNSVRSNIFQMGSTESLASFAWCCPRALMMTGSGRQIKPEFIPEDPNHTGLAGFRLIETMNISTQRLPGTTIKKRITSYWFDPARDYLLTERLTIEDRDEGISKNVQKTTKAAQTKGGKWYPVVIIIESSYPGLKGKIQHIVQEQRIIIDTEPVFKESIFEDISL
jgi:hypothetical protein